MIHKAIYKMGTKLRNPDLKDKYNFLKETENWNRQQLEDYQTIQLKSLVKKAYEKSLFYKELFQHENITPDNINTLNDLKKIPVISKRDVLENVQDIQNTSGYKKLILSETSGSSGEPLVFYRNLDWDTAHRAAQLRGYSWYNVKPWELNGYFWGYDFSQKEKGRVKRLDKLLNRFRIFSYDENQILKFTKKLKQASYLEGYSSMIYEVSKIINKHSLGPFKLKMIKGTSEKIYDSYQTEILNAFGQKMISEYGAAETGIIAYECTKGNMHIAMENVIVEEEEGEAIITNLNSNSFPIIRYKLGDYIKLDTETRCDCGMEHTIVKEVLGRVGKNIYGKKNKYPSLTLYYIFKNFSLKNDVIINYQAIQKEKGKLDLHLDTKVSKKLNLELMIECESYFHDDLKVSIFPESLKRNYEEKFTDFISKID